MSHPASPPHPRPCCLLPQDQKCKFTSGIRQGPNSPAPFLFLFHGSSKQQSQRSLHPYLLHNNTVSWVGVQKRDEPKDSQTDSTAKGDGNLQPPPTPTGSYPTLALLGPVSQANSPPLWSRFRAIPFVTDLSAGRLGCF